MNFENKRFISKPVESSIAIDKTVLSNLTLIRILKALKDLFTSEEYAAFKIEHQSLLLTLKNHFQFRKDVAYDKTSKVAKYITRWMEIDIKDVVEAMIELTGISASKKTGLIRVPSISLFGYLLGNILRSFHLLLHLDAICMDAAIVILNKIGKGHFIMIFSTFLAFVSRIRALSLDMANQLCDHYFHLRELYQLLINDKDITSSEQYPKDIRPLLDNYLHKESRKCNDRNINDEVEKLMEIISDKNSNIDQSISQSRKKTNIQECNTEYKYIDKNKEMCTNGKKKNKNKRKLVPTMEDVNSFIGVEDLGENIPPKKKLMPPMENVNNFIFNDEDLGEYIPPKKKKKKSIIKDEPVILNKKKKKKLQKSK